MHREPLGVAQLADAARLLRREVLAMTTAAGSGGLPARPAYFSGVTGQKEADSRPRSPRSSLCSSAGGSPTPVGTTMASPLWMRVTASAAVMRFC